MTETQVYNELKKVAKAQEEKTYIVWINGIRLEYTNFEISFDYFSLYNGKNIVASFHPNDISKIESL